MKQPLLPYQNAVVYDTNLDTHVEARLEFLHNRYRTGSIVSSVKTPGYKTIPRKALPLNGYRFQNFVEVLMPSSLSYRLPAASRFGGMKGDIQSRAPFDGSLYFGYPIPNADHEKAKAISRALSKIKDQRVNLGQAFLERKQTVGMITTSVNRLVSAAIAIKHAKFDHAIEIFGKKHRPLHWKMPKVRNPRSIKEHLSNHWLEFSWGWRPFVDDIYGSCQLLAETYNGSKPTSVFCKVAGSDTRVGTHTIYNCYGVGNLVTEYTTKENRNARIYLEYVEEDSFRTMMSTTGLTNPISLAWELLPYSMVVDYVLQVGEYLNNLDATVGYSFKRGTLSTFVSSKGLHYIKGRSVVQSFNGFYQDNETVIAEGFNGYYFFVDKQRDILSTFPTTQLNIGTGLGIKRAANCIALLTQVFSRR